MIGQTISHYKILEKLGEGGMGVVYKARDLRLDRDVAIKFLPQHLSEDEESRTRFIHEAKAASALDHPHIGIIHEIDESTDGQTFIVMACYEGRSFSDMLENERPTIDEALDISIQIASGLSAAHGKGITHRDIKPSNILITEDKQVKIVDFGLAKLAGSTKITRSGTTLGTAAYMSPELAKGDPVDERSDIFSLGVVIYESFTGHLPFRGDYEAALLYEIVHEPPDPMSTYRSDLPPGLQEIVDKALEKEVTDRYQTAEELKTDLETLRDTAPPGTSSAPRSTRKSAPRTAASRLQRALPLMLGAIILGLLLAIILPRLQRESQARDLALAVIDFRNLANPEDITTSASISGLLHVGFVEGCPIRVISPEYLYDLRRRYFGNAHGPIEPEQALEVARQAGASVMLTGQIAQAGSQQLVTWRLVDIWSGKNIAARRADGGLLTEIADQIIASALPLIAREYGKEEPVVQPSVGELTTDSPQAYQHCIAGVMARERFDTEEAIRELEQAVAIDSTFALAYLELSRTYHTSGKDYGGLARKHVDTAWNLRTRLGIKDRMRLEAWRDQLYRNITDALNLYREMLIRWPDDRETLSSLADRLNHWWYCEEALSVAEKGLLHYPDDVWLGLLYQYNLATLGRHEEALEASRTYAEQHPDMPNSWDSLGRRFLEIGAPDSALAAFNKANALKENFSRLSLSYCAYARGDIPHAIDIIESILAQNHVSMAQQVRLQTRNAYMPSLSLLHAESGRFVKALEIFEQARQKISEPIDEIYFNQRRNRVLLRMGRAEEVARWAREQSKHLAAGKPTNEDLQYVRTARMEILNSRARSLVALDSLDAAREAVDALRASENLWGGFARSYALKISAEIALAEGNPQNAIMSLFEMNRHGVHKGGLLDIEYRETLARAHAMAGELEEASQVLEDLIRIYGGHRIALYELGKLYQDLGRAEDAANAYTAFLDAWSEADDGLPQVADAMERLAALEIHTP